MDAAAVHPRRVLLPLGLAVCLSLFGDLTLYAVLPSQRATVGLSLASVGIMPGANRVIRIPGNPIVGALYDRVGRRRLFLLGMLLGVVSTLGYGVVRGFLPFLLARLMWGVAWTLINVGGMTMVQDITHRANRGRLTGIYNAWMLVGFAVGPLLGGFMVDTLGFHVTMRLYAATTAVGFLVALLGLPETHTPGAGGRNPGADSRPPIALGQRLTDTVIRGARVLRQNPRLLSVMLLTVIYQFVGEGVALSTLNLLMDERFGAHVTLGTVVLGVATATGILSAFRSLVAGGTGPLAGHLSDHRNERGLVLVGSLVLGAVGFGLLGLVQSLPGIVIAVAIGAVSAGGGMAGLTAAIGDLAPSDRRGAAMGAYATAGDIGAATGPFLAYALILVVPLAWVYALCAIAFVMGMGLLHRLYNRD